MRRKPLRFGKGFRVALGSARAQAAEMVIPPGAAEGARGTSTAGRINGCMSSPGPARHS
jgi:hypothetical protein